MIYQGRELDPLELWSQWVDFPTGTTLEDEFSPLVFCPNPAHENTRSPAFQVNLFKPLVHCFAHCGISGTYEHALAIVLGLSREDGSPNEYAAGKVLLRRSVLSPGTGRATPGARKGRAGITDDVQLARDEDDFRAGRFAFLPASALAYLDERGIDSDSRARFELGYDPSSRRLVIPAYDERSVLRFLIRRALARERPKYLYSKGFPVNRLLFGSCFVDRERVQSEGLVLVEGSIDVIRLHGHGIRSALGVLGSQLSKDQQRIVESLRPRRVYLMFDRDMAGIRAIFDAIGKLRKCPLRICRYPEDKADPATLSREEAATSLARAMTLQEFIARTSKGRVSYGR